MTTANHLRALLDRVEGGEGRDLALEGDILRALLSSDLRQWPKRYIGLGEAITSSIDAAVALVEKVLPGWAWGVSGEPPVHGKSWHASVSNVGFGILGVADDVREKAIVGEASYVPGGPARALVAALLRAKIAQEGQDA